MFGGVQDATFFIGVRRADSRANAKDATTYVARKTYSATEWAAMHDPTKANLYWILVDDGHIEVGLGDRIGLSRELMFDDVESSPVAIQYAGVSTVNSMTATFGRLCFESAGDTGRDVFSMDITTGQLKVKRALDYETREAYSFLVTVEDDGEGRLSSTAVVEVLITDLNEKPVVRNVCAQDALAHVCTSVDENSPAGTLVGTPIIVDDPEAFNTHVYTITAGNIREAFTINAATGQLSVAKNVLNHEDDLTAGRYELKVVATDDGSPDALSGEGTVIIDINDVNEQPTIGNFARTVRENSDNTVTMPPPVFGSDVDDPNTPFGALTYSFVGGDAAQFRIDSVTGLIGVQSGANLDFETKADYFVTVRATDGGAMFAEANVDVTLVDVNERPEIEHAAYVVLSGRVLPCVCRACAVGRAGVGGRSANLLCPLAPSADVPWTRTPCLATRWVRHWWHRTWMRGRICTSASSAAVARTGSASTRAAVRWRWPRRAWTTRRRTRTR